MAKQLLQAFFTARAATDWLISQRKGPGLDHEQMAREVQAMPALSALQSDVVPEWDDPLA